MANIIYRSIWSDAFGARNRAVVKCCFHSDRSPSLSINAETGAFKCFACDAFGGDVIAFEMKRTGKEFKEVVRDLCGGFPPLPALKPLVQARQIETDQRKADAITRAWAESKVIVPGCPAFQYLTTTRNLSLQQMPTDLRWHEAMPYWDRLPGDDELSTREFLGDFPAIVAAIRNPEGELISIHRTFLTVDGKKAFGASPKQLMPSPRPGITKGAAVRLYEAVDILGLAEGIETSIAANNRFAVPVWACISAEGLKSVVVPQHIKKVIIFADHDRSGTGEVKATSLFFRLLQEGRQVKSVMPSQVGTDWANLVTEERNEERTNYNPA